MCSPVDHMQLSCDDYSAKFVDTTLAVIRARVLRDRPHNVADYFLEHHKEIKRDIEVCSYSQSTTRPASDAAGCAQVKQPPHHPSPPHLDPLAVMQLNREYGQQQHNVTTGAPPTPPLPGPCPAVASPNPSSIIAFLHTCSLLKGTKRTGWILRGLTDVESVADHSWRMALMVLLLGSSAGIDSQRAMSIAVVHDLAEALVGDIAPGQGVDKATKRLLEADAINSIVGHMSADNAPLGQHVRDLWLEYEAAQTAEAVFVKDVDKLEMILQAREYERARGVDLQDFFDGTRGKIVTDCVLALQRALLTEREASGTSFVHNHDKSR
jgi:putative hydrolase of HD superfamily